MSMKKFTKKMLAIVAAAAMTMGLAMPAFASEAGTEGTKVTEAYISKTYNTEVGKAFNFNFTATPVGNNHSITMPTIAFTETETGSNTKVGKIDFGTFTEAGKYEYTVKEGAVTPEFTDSEHEKLIMSKAEYKMDVYVVQDGANFNIENIIVNKTKDNKGNTATGKVDIGSNPTNNGFRFENTYVPEAGTGPKPSTPYPDYTTYGSLNVTKKVENANLDTREAVAEFDFTATFAFPAGTDANTLGGVKADGTAITLTGAKSDTYEFKMTHNKSVKFTGLPVGTKISVTEAATPNYKGSAKVTINGVEDSTVVTTSKYNEKLTVSDKKLGQKKNAVDVTNEYNNVPTTGIIMNTLPYVLMVALCGAALVAFVASKRRKVQK